MNALELAILAGAGGATVARLLTGENGPLFVFGRIRALAVETARRVEARGNKNITELANSLVELAHCPICQSVWWGVGLALLVGLLAGLPALEIGAAMFAAPSIAWAIGELGQWPHSNL